MTHSQQQPQAEHVDGILDREAALAFVGRDPSFLNELLTAFHDYRIAIIERIENAVQEENATELCEAAHQLKGALGNFHARAAMQTAKRLESAARKGSLQDAGSLCETLEQDLDVLCNAVGDLLHKLQPTD